MFGLFYALSTLATATISSIKAKHEDSECLKRGIEAQKKGKNTANVYYDRLGTTRDIKTNQKVFVDHMSCELRGEDACVRDMNGKVLRNLSKEKRMERWNELKENTPDGVTVCFWKKHSVNNVIWGDQYKDLKTGKIFVARSFQYPKKFGTYGAYGMFYMDCQTGLLVRETDSYIKTRNREAISDETVQRFIDDFNERQMNSKKDSFYYWNSSMINC